MRAIIPVTAVLVLLLADDVRAQENGSIERSDLQTLEAFVGSTEADIQERFGAPDETGVDEGKNAIVWTYVVRAPGEIGSEVKVLGYRQFAFWNGLVAGVNTKWFLGQDEVTQIYEASLDYMAEGDRTIARGGGIDRSIFTDSLRISRRHDNIWMADMLLDTFDSQATLLIGDAGYRMCRKAVQAEVKRVESKYGVDLRQASTSN